MLVGKNVPANVLRKKILITAASGGRDAGSMGQSSTIQRYAIKARSKTTSATAKAIHLRSA